MATKYYVEYEHGVPQTGDMLVWDGEKWRVLGAAYQELTVTNDEATWDCLEGLNAKVDASDLTGDELTLGIKNIVAGMSGDLVIDAPIVRGDGISVALDLNDGAITDIKGHGLLTEITNLNHICWVYDGEVFTYNIAMYDD